MRNSVSRRSPFISGVIKNIETKTSTDVVTKHITVEFNHDKLAWHYEWRSNKHISFTLHTVEILMYVDDAAGVLRNIACFTSPEFQVISTKATLDLLQEGNNVEEKMQHGNFTFNEEYVDANSGSFLEYQNHANADSSLIQHQNNYGNSDSSRNGYVAPSNNIDTSSSFIDHFEFIDEIYEL